MKFPLPNDKLDGGIVIASHYSDNETAEAIILLTETPFYRHVLVSLSTGVVLFRARFASLTDAIEDWE